METHSTAPVDILLVEDSVTDAMLTREALSESRIPNTVHVVEDGEEAMAFLRSQAPFAGAPRPDIVLLDLNLPRKDGCEVLAEVKIDDDLRSIPVIILTTSRSGVDIRKAYGLYANCYITKPMDFHHFIQVVRSIEEFWFSVASLPQGGYHA